MAFFEVLWHGEAIGDGGDLQEALQSYAAVRPDDDDWVRACGEAGADPTIRRYASFEAFLDNADELDSIAVTAEEIRSALEESAAGTPPP